MGRIDKNIKKMTRTDRGQNHSPPKYINRDSALHDDLVYDVVKWLSPSFLLSSCVLVSKQWKSVIEARIEFEFELNELQTSRFISKKHPPAEKITRLSLSATKELFPTRRFTYKYSLGESNTNGLNRPLRKMQAPTSSLKDMRHLKHLSLRGLSLSGDCLQKILDASDVDSFVIEECDYQWSDLAPFANSNCQLSLDLPRKAWKESHSVDECLAVLERIPHIVSMKRLPSRADDIDRFYEFVSKLEHLSKISMRPRETGLKYLPLMRHVREIELIESVDTPVELPDLREFVHLESLSIIRNDDTSAETNTSKPLRSVLKQMKRLRAGRANIDQEDWYNMDRLNDIKELVLEYECLVMPFKFPMANLTRLFLVGCEIEKHVAQCIGSLHNLTLLSTYGSFLIDQENQKDDLTLAHICDEGQCGNVEFKLTRLNEIRMAIPPNTSNALNHLSKMPRLEILHLYSRNIRVISCKQIKCIVAVESLIDLSLSDFSNSDGSSGGFVMTARSAECLSSAIQLRRLHITSPLFASALLEPISAMDNLRRLDLRTSISESTSGEECILTPSIDLEGVEILSEMENLVALGIDLSGLLEPCTDELLQMTNLEYLYISCDSDHFNFIKHALADAETRTRVTLYGI